MSNLGTSKQTNIDKSTHIFPHVFEVYLSGLKNWKDKGIKDSSDLLKILFYYFIAITNTIYILSKFKISQYSCTLH